MRSNAVVTEFTLGTSEVHRFLHSFIHSFFFYLYLKMSSGILAQKSASNTRAFACPAVPLRTSRGDGPTARVVSTGRRVRVASSVCSLTSCVCQDELRGLASCYRTEFQDRGRVLPDQRTPALRGCLCDTWPLAAVAPPSVVSCRLVGWCRLAASSHSG